LYRMSGYDLMSAINLPRAMEMKRLVGYTTLTYGTYAS
jgi:hypothetical protein